ncbi:uncharacterized protein SAPINGB_P001145 [Magnusiomyces paraingens]|uniref:Uncharacterized protein n=1 Tax=Magnusiomyces paraingens TaxID=2606893 RepID=A0A5E8B477_9ASCO|nr:uncharacterized protein SAPINGB_P001145 [Saprochaete ingens]VVT46300.1 unnamed protein product [Saprochaete ingens]
MARSVKSSRLSLVQYTAPKRGASSAATSSKAKSIAASTKGYQPVRNKSRVYDQPSSFEESLSEKSEEEEDSDDEDIDDEEYEEETPKKKNNTTKRKRVTINENLPRRYAPDKENNDMGNEKAQKEGSVIKKRVKQHQTRAVKKQQTPIVKSKFSSVGRESHSSDKESNEEDSDPQSANKGNDDTDDNSQEFEDFDADDLWQDPQNTDSAAAAILAALAEDFASPESVYRLATRICAGIGYAPSSVAAKDLRVACGAIHDLGAQHVDATCESFAEQPAAVSDAVSLLVPVDYSTVVSKHELELQQQEQQQQHHAPETLGIMALRKTCSELAKRLTGHTQVLREALETRKLAADTARETTETRKTQMLGQMLGYLRQLAARHAVHMRALRVLHERVGDAAGLVGGPEARWDEASMLEDAGVRKEITAAEIALMEELGVGEDYGMIVIDEEKTDVEE